MRTALFFAAIVFCTSLSNSQDLASIERKIAKEPAYKSGAPRYALMVLGEKMIKRVWLVIDGDVLYADLNGNGDLTEEGEKIAKMDFGKFTPPDGMVSFEIKEIQDGELVHRNFGVTMEPAERLANLATDFLKLIGKESKAYSYNVGGMMQIPELQGSGHDGRKRMLAWIDEKGPLQFSDKAATAPILHFGGKLKVGLCGDHQLVVGRAREISLGIGTPGVGNGSTVWMEYNEIPLKTPVYASVTFPRGKNATVAQVQKSMLIDRCCGFNLMGPIATPDDVGLGSAQVEFRLDGVLQPHQVEPLKTSIDVVAPKNKITFAPVTKRIAQEYIFPKRYASPGHIHFSPDGKQLLAAENSEGLVAVWEVKSGEQQIQFEVGENRYSQDFLHVAADWSAVYGAKTGTRKGDAEVINGKEGVRFTFDGALLGFDLASGKQVAQLSHTPPRCPMAVLSSPDGKRIAAFEDLSGIFEADKRDVAREISIWDLETQKPTPIGERGDFPLGFTDDGKLLMVMSLDQSILKVLDVESGALRWIQKFPKGERFHPICQDSAGDLIVGVNHLTPKTDGGYDACKVVVLDSSTGEQKSTIEIDGKRGAHFKRITAASGVSLIQAMMLTTEKGLYFGSEIRLYAYQSGNLKKICQIPFETRDEKFASHSLSAVLSPDGKLCAAAVNFMPKSRVELMAMGLEPDPLEFPQPQVWIINLKTGNVAEKIDLPQCLLSSLAFAPDGKSLAVSGLGRVLRLDISDWVAATVDK
jgi:hypothetical protein